MNTIRETFVFEGLLLRMFTHRDTQNHTKAIQRHSTVCLLDRWHICDIQEIYSINMQILLLHCKAMLLKGILYYLMSHILTSHKKVCTLNGIGSKTLKCEFGHSTFEKIVGI